MITPTPEGGHASYTFLVGKSYSRNDIYEIVGVPEDLRGGDWDTGYHRHEEAFFIFANVGIAGQTGHDYANQFDGDRLIWYGKTGAKFTHPSVQALLQKGRRVYVFYRIQKRGAFVFAGLGRAYRIDKKAVPVRVIWSFESRGEFHPERAPQEITLTELKEGAVARVFVNKYERNPVARKLCIDYYGLRCQACKTDFEEVYGDLGRGFIHVHHVKPISEIGESYVVDPIKDLLPVCPNCHAMLHRDKGMTVELLRMVISKTRGIHHR